MINMKSRNSITSKKDMLIQVYIFLIIILTSGHIYGTYIYNKEMIIVAFISALLINNFKPIKKSNLILFFLLSSVILVNYFVWMSNVDGYIALVIKIATALLLVNNIDYDKFKKKYVIFFTFYSVISIICYLLMITNWQIILNIPIKSVWLDEMRPTLLYSFPAKEFNRNFGFYREGGMYAIFLDIALLLTFKVRDIKNILLIRVLLIITIATTFSTTGIIGAILILFISSNNKRSIFKNSITFILMILLLVFIEVNNGIIRNKISMNNQSFLGRTEEFNVVANIVNDNLLTGVGYQNNTEISKYTSMIMTNGILSLWSQFGIIIGTFILIVYLYSYCKLSKKIIERLLYMGLFILFCSLEPVMFTVLFIMVIFK